jgi:hypothetical protein
MPAALRLRRLDVDTGAELALTRTRGQLVFGMAFRGDRLFAASNSRLFELDSTGLSVIRQWDKRLVRWSTQVVVCDEVIVEAGWYAPYIGIVDLATGAVRRVKVGKQPLLFTHNGEVLVAAGFHGGVSTLDVEHASLHNLVKTFPMTAIAVGKEVWAVTGAQPQPPNIVGAPPEYEPPLFRRGSDTITRLTGAPWSTRLDADCRRIWCDDARRVLWCLLEDQRPHAAARRVSAISQVDGAVLTEFEIEPSSVEDDWRKFGPTSIVHLDPVLGIVLTSETYSRTLTQTPWIPAVIGGEATLACYALPSVSASLSSRVVEPS